MWIGHKFVLLIRVQSSSNRSLNRTGWHNREGTWHNWPILRCWIAWCRKLWRVDSLQWRQWCWQFSPVLIKNFDEYSARYLSLNLNLSFQVVWHCHMPVGSQLIYLQTESHNYHMPHEEYTKSIQNFLPKLLLRRRILILPGISGFAYGPYLPDKSSSFSHLNGS